MKKYSLPLTLLLFSCLSANEPYSSLSTSENAPTDCGDSSRPIRVAVRHIEPRGIGYDEGYTTLEGFITPIYPNTWLKLKDEWLPFADLRLHIFNDGKPALNAGLGIRYLAPRMIWGLNFYYDYRKTSHQHYNQVGLGYEAIGKIWDFRLNGYLPVGDTSWNSQTKFDGFQGNYMMLSKKHEDALKGFNAEAGVHISEFKNKRIRNMFTKTPFYVAAGPYYLEGHGDSTWGGQARFTLDLFEYLRLEGNASYDKIFHGIGQGQLTVQIPLGRKKKVFNRKGESCGRALAMSERAVQRVDRFEIIPIHKHHTESPAIDPATGEPYVFWFVNNTSHSAGTFESPFPTLLLAQNASSPGDVIYVFPGDGTDTGMNQGITLQNNQELLSTSISYSFNTTVGTITLPAWTTGSPLISNTAIVLPVIGLADNNVVSGMTIHDTFSSGLSGIYGSVPQITNALIDQCTITSDAGIAVEFQGINLGTITISNSFIDSPESNAILFIGSIGGDVTISNCEVGSSNVDSAIFIAYGNMNSVTISNCALESPGSYPLGFEGMGINSINIINSTFDGLDGIGFEGDQLGTTVIDSCGITNTGSGTSGIFYSGVNSSITTTINNCEINSLGDYGLSITGSPTSSPPPFYLILTNNTASGAVFGYFIDNPGAQSEFVLEENNNTGTSEYNNVTIVP